MLQTEKSAQSSAGGGMPGANGKHKWRALSLLGMVSVAMVLNGTSVNISISALVADLDTSVSQIQAVLSLYSLVMAVCMLPAAKLADRFGAKRILPVGAILFGCGALLVAAAQNSAMLMAGMSFLQGLAASLMLPTALSLLSAAYPGEKRPAALAAYSAVASLTMAVAPLLAGALTTYLSWRLVYGLEVALVILLLLRMRILREIDAPAPDPKARFDAVGALLSALALGCLIVGALLAKTYGWFVSLRPFTVGSFTMDTIAPTAVLLAGGALFAALLVWWLVRAARTGRPALIDIALFQNRGYNAVLLTKLLAQLAMGGMLFVLPVYLQNVLGYTALATGISMLPLPLLLLLMALFVVRLAAKTGKKAIIFCGTLLVAAGALVMYLVFSAGGAVSGWQLLPAVAVLGAGMGCITSLANAAALASAPPRLANQASGMLTTTNNLASSLGTALSGSLLLGGLRLALSNLLETAYPAQFGGYSHRQLGELLAAAADKMQAASPDISGLGTGQLSALQTTLQNALNTSMAHLMLVMAVVAAAAALIALFGLPKEKKPGVP